MFGNIHKINEKKGFAFAEGDDGRDYFIHWSEVLRSSIAFRNLKIGMRMEFIPVENEDPKKAPRGEQVKYTGEIVTPVPVTVQPTSIN